MDSSQENRPPDALPLFESAPPPPPAGAPEAASGRIPASIPMPAQLPRDPAAPPVPAPAPAPVPARPKPAAVPVETASIPVTSFGPYLGELRRRRLLEIADLADATKIRSTYLEAIEREDYEMLPPPVYVLAYVKTLCRYFQLSPELTDMLTADLRQHLEYEAPEDPTKSVVDLELSQENPILFKRILWIAGASILLLAGLVTVLVLLLIPGSGAGGPAAGPDGVPTAERAAERVSEQQLISLQPAPALEIIEYSGPAGN